MFYCCWTLYIDWNVYCDQENVYGLARNVFRDWRNVYSAVKYVFIISETFFRSTRNNESRKRYIRSGTFFKNDQEQWRKETLIKKPRNVFIGPKMFQRQSEKVSSGNVYWKVWNVDLMDWKTLHHTRKRSIRMRRLCEPLSFSRVTTKKQKEKHKQEINKKNVIIQHKRFPVTQKRYLINHEINAWLKRFLSVTLLTRPSLESAARRKGGRKRWGRAYEPPYWVTLSATQRWLTTDSAAQ